MKISTKFLLISIPTALVAFFSGQALWPDTADSFTVPLYYLPYFVLLGEVQAALFGVGIAFLVLGWPLVRGVDDGKPLAVATFISIAWMLIAWWPHDNLSRSVGVAVPNLFYFESAFRLTLILAAATVASYFWKTVKR